MNSVKIEIQHDSGVTRFNRENLPADAIGFAVGHAIGQDGLILACKTIDLAEGEDVDYLIVTVKAKCA